MTAADMAAFRPQAALAAGVVGALGLGLLRRPPPWALRLLAFAALAAALAFAVAAPDGGTLFPVLSVGADGQAWLVLVALGALPLAFWDDGEDDARTALFLGSVLGMTLLAASWSLAMLFISLEFMSLPAYLLVARSRPGPRALEGALKYFFAGGVAGALFMLGLSLFYADTRVLVLSQQGLSPLGQAGVALMGTAALFKVGAVPLHWWLPDAYEGAAPEVAGFLSTSMKAAAVLLLMRLVSLAPSSEFARWLPAVGAVTSLAGAAMALRQERLQRLLAYSSISHAGLLVLGVGAWARSGLSAEGASALFFYLAAYAFMSNGAFGFLKHAGVETRAQLKGLGASRPLASAAFTVILFSLGGIPPTGGFVAKLLLLWQAVDAGLLGAACAAGVAALAALGYYLALVRDLWFEPGEAGRGAPLDGEGRGAGLVIACASAALALGAAPWALGLWGGGR